VIYIYIYLNLAFIWNRVVINDEKLSLPTFSLLEYQVKILVFYVHFTFSLIYIVILSTNQTYLLVQMIVIYMLFILNSVSLS